MERIAILEFIASNFSFFKELDLLEMTICLYGKEYDGQMMQSFSLGDELFIYHVKLPRIEKVVKPLSMMNEGILDFVNSIDEVTSFSKSEFNFDITEPYKIRQLKEIDFGYLTLIPIYKKKIRSGTILAYGNNLCKQSLNKNSLTMLVNRLNNSEEDTLKHCLNEALNVKEKTFLLENKDKYYFSSSNKLTKKEVEEFKNNYLVKAFSLPFPCDEYTCYVKKDAKDSNYLDFLALETLNINDTFTLIYFYYSELVFKKSLQTYLKEEGFNTEYQVVVLGDNYYLLIFNELINCRHFIQSLSTRKAYYLTLTSKQVKNTFDLAKLSKYILDVHPQSYDKEGYLKYINEIGQDKLKITPQSKKIKLVNSKTHDEVCLVNHYAGYIKYDDNLQKYLKDSLNSFERGLKTEENLGIFLNSSSLAHQKVNSLFKKINNKQKQCYVIITDDLNDLNKLTNAIIELKKLNIKVIVDTTISFNLSANSVMKIVDGVYFNYQEYLTIKNKQNSLGSLLATYFFNDNKFIIFHLEDEVKSEIYEDELIYFIEESVG